mmetsp:Transcript_6353/g.16563  ORF Transcript_6353/g.16563 Transcript_6353/m.16563 type:complete len:107 (-) Transcript_6353:305-625(-)
MYRAAIGDSEFERIAKYWRGTIWHWPRDSGLVPAPLYLYHCVLAARNLGPAAAQSFEQRSFLADRCTTLAEYLAREAASGNDVLLEGEHEFERLHANSILRTRFGG